ncbi:MAG: methyl-accepting chemotaxis protein [Zoogloeaceae bacterium]|nr:methyl-accepting chemotaxis protein [Zoogloeaceae bacterium]
MTTAFTSSESQLIAQRVTGDRIMAAVSWFMFVLCLLVAFVHGEWGAAIGFGLVFAISMQACAMWSPGSRVTRVVSAVVFMGFAALLIHEMHGMIEMHFAVFVLLAFLLFYNDWLPPVVGAGVIAAHHLGFYFLQISGVGVWVFPHNSCGLDIVFIHAAFVVFETALLVFMALKHERAVLESGEVIAMLSAVLADDTIDLRVRSKATAGSASQFSRLIEALCNIVGQISHHSKTIVDSGGKIASLAGSVSYASGLQKQQVENVVTAMEEMNASISGISADSHQAAENMAQSKEEAVKSGRVIEEVIEVIHALSASTRETATTMEELGRVSESIGNIVVTIREITEQTNLLALNASIEAARAGEQGRGFAVVADEVRKLAERTATATQEVGGIVSTLQRDTASAVQLIRSGATRVDEGVDVAEKARGALKQIISAAEKQTEIIASIAHATAEQVTAMGLVDKSVHEIMQMADESALNAGLSAEECKGISELALDLQTVVQKFHVGESETITVGA